MKSKIDIIKNKLDRTINENISNNVLIVESKPPETLSLEEQKKRFKLGDIVYIRKDSFKIFGDIDPYGMKEYLGTYGEIIRVQSAFDIYGSYGENRAGDGYVMYSSDLVLTIKKPNDPYSEDWYWWYKCLINPKFSVPSYNPKKIKRTLDE